MAPDFESRQNALLHCLGALRDPQQRLAWVVDQARQRPPFPAAWRTPERLVPGCAARLWLHPWLETPPPLCRFAVDSDSAILKAFAALICDLYDGLSPDQVVSREPDVLHRAGLLTQLTENRQRTILRVRAVLRDFAQAQTSADPASPPPSA